MEAKKIRKSAAPRNAEEIREDIVNRIGYLSLKLPEKPTTVYWPCLKFDSWKELHAGVQDLVKSRAFPPSYKLEMANAILNMQAKGRKKLEGPTFVLLGDQLLAGMTRVVASEKDQQHMEMFEFAMAVMNDTVQDTLSGNHLRRKAHDLALRLGGLTEEDQEQKNPLLIVRESEAVDEVSGEDCGETLTPKPQRPRRVSKSAFKATPAKAKSVVKKTPRGKVDRKISNDAPSRRSSNRLETPSKSKTPMVQKAPKPIGTPEGVENFKRQATSTAAKKTTYQVPTPSVPDFSRIQRLLEKGGFIFRKNLYCRPGMDPRSNPEAKEGSDYFSTIERFRSHLCAHGVNVNPAGIWSPEEKALLSQWVRYDVVGTFKLSPKDIPPMYDPLSPKAVFPLLMKLGFGWKQFNNLMTNKSLTLPGISDEEFKSGIGVFEREEILLYLARFGFPDNSTFEAITPQERLSFELFVSDIPENELDTFDFIVDEWDFSKFTGISVATSRREKKRRRDESEDHLMDSLAFPSTPSPSPRTSSQKRKTTYRKTPRKSESVSDDPNESTGETAVPSSPVLTQASSNATVVSLTPEKVVPLPDQVQGRTKKLEACMAALGLSFNMGKVTRPRGSKLMENLDTISDILRKQIDYHLKDEREKLLDHPLYICGPPGIGKTSGVRSCIEAAVAFSKTHPEYEEGSDPIPLFIEASSLTVSSNPMESLLRFVAEVFGINSSSKAAVEKKLVASKRGCIGNLLILVIDEIDMLLEGNQTVLKLLHSWTTNKKMKLVLCGISNSTGNDNYFRLDDALKLQKDHTWTFKPYNDKELACILKERVGTKIFEPQAIAFLSKKVSNMGGDARKALELARSSVERCQEELKNCPDEDSHENLVKVKHVVASVNHTSSSRLKDLISGLPNIAKIILCVSHTLASAEITRTDVLQMKRLVQDAMKSTGQVEVMGNSLFTDLLEVLAEQGLIRFGDTGHKKLSGATPSDITKMPIELDVQLDDIGAALNKSLGHDFYRKMRSYAAGHRSMFQRE